MLHPDLRWIPDVHRAHRDPWLCHEVTSGPPLLPRELRPRGLTLAAGTQVVVTSADGAKLRAHVARPARPSDAGMVIVPDVRGLHPFYGALADRLAEAGVNAIAFDLFGRTNGTAVPPASFYEGQEPPFRAHVAKTTLAGLQEDLRAASAHLRAETGARRVFAMGFCFGGRVAFNASWAQPDLAGVVGFYGMPAQREPGDMQAPILKIKEMRAPVLGLFGGADPGIPQGAIDAFDAALGAMKLPRKLVTYPNTPHSFFDRTYADHEGACDDAWRRLLGFVASGDPTATTA